MTDPIGAPSAHTPSYYHKLVDFAVLAGEVMMTSGAETHRVEDTVTRILSVVDVPRSDVFVVSTGLTITLSYEPTHTITVTHRVGRASNNLGRVYEVNRISRAFCAGEISLEEAHLRMGNVRHMHLYSAVLQVLGAMLTSGTFAFMFGGSIPDALVAALCGMLSGLATVPLAKRIPNAFLTTALSSLLTALAATSLAYLGNSLWQLGLQSQYVIVGAIMPVVPGVAITNAIRDLLYGDYVSATARMLDAFLSAAAVAVGIGMGLAVSRELGFTVTTLDFVFDENNAVGLRLLWEAIAAFLACFGFCFLLEAPRRLILPSSLTGAVCWLMYLIAGSLGAGSAWAALLASAAVYLLSYMLARRLKAPVSVFLITAILPLVPGCNIYRTVYSMITGEGSTAEALAATLMMAGAIALGIFVADMINGMIMPSKRRRLAARRRS